MSEMSDVRPAENNNSYRVYNLPGVDRPVVARKGGPTLKDVKEKESYRELRSNQKEFGVASMMAKVLRESLPEQLAVIPEKYCSGKLTAKFRNLAKNEEGETGKRPILVSKYGTELDLFDFNAENPFNESFNAPVMLRRGSHKGHIILHIPSFVPTENFIVPIHATNFKINAQLSAISDYRYRETPGEYEAVCEEENGLSNGFETNMLPVLRVPMQSITTQLSVSNGLPLSQGVGVFLILSLRFFRYEHGVFHQLKEGGTMQIFKSF